jgi:hypothetical protein
MSQQLKSRTRQARGSTPVALPQQTIFRLFGTYAIPRMVAHLALRANHVRHPDGVPNDQVGVTSADLSPRPLTLLPARG